MMGVCSLNNKEWVLTTLANYKNSILTIGLPDIGSETYISSIMQQTMLQSVSCSGLTLPKFLMLKKEGQIPHLQNIISFENSIIGEHMEQAKALNLKMYTFDQVIQEGRSLKSKFNMLEPTPSTIVEIIFTSGSTGKPKGVSVDHRGIIEVINGHKARGFSLNQNDTHLSYLNLSYGTERLMI